MKFLVTASVLLLPGVYALSLSQERMVIAPFVVLSAGIAVYALWSARKQHGALSDPPPPEYAELEGHANKLLDQGIAFDAVRSRLIGAGWSAEKVDLVLHNAHRPDTSVEKLMFYVRDQMRRQQPKMEIRQRLLSAHWDEKLVNLVLE